MKAFEPVEFIEHIQPGDYLADGVETGIALSRVTVGKLEGFRVRLLINGAESFMVDGTYSAARLVEVTA